MAEVRAAPPAVDPTVPATESATPTVPTFRDGEEGGLAVGTCADWDEFLLPVDDGSEKPISGGGTRADVIRHLVFLLLQSTKKVPTSLEAHDMPLAPLLAAEQGITDVRSIVSSEQSVNSLALLARTASEKLTGSRWAEALQKSHQGMVTPSETVVAADRTFDILVTSVSAEVQARSLSGYLNALVGRIATGGVLLLEARSGTQAESQQVLSGLHTHFAIVNSTSPSIVPGERQIFLARGSYGGAPWESRTGVSSVVRISPDRSKVVKSPKPDSPYADTYTRELTWLVRLQPCGYVPQVLAANAARQEIVMTYVGVTIEEAVARATETAPDRPLRMGPDWTAQLLSMHAAFARVGVAYAHWGLQKLCVRAVGGVPGRLAVVGFGRCGAVLVDSTCGGTVAALAASPAAPRTASDLSQDLKKLGLLG